MALIARKYLDSVVGIGVGDDPANRQWVGTGFIYGQFVKEENEDRTYNIVLVTNKHVLEGYPAVWLKFNRSSGGVGSQDFRVPLLDSGGTKLWSSHPTADVAAFAINIQMLIQSGHEPEVVLSDQNTELLADLRDRGASEGDGVFLLGFPMNLVGQNRQYVICRIGCLARIRDLYDGESDSFLIDALLFPGGSGGPVFAIPTATALKNTAPLQKSCLIGIVHGYLSYSDVAVSKQTQRPRVVFEENSGLSKAYPVDVINEVVATEDARSSS